MTSINASRYSEQFDGALPRVWDQAIGSSNVAAVGCRPEKTHQQAIIYILSTVWGVQPAGIVHEETVASDDSCSAFAAVGSARHKRSV